MVYIFNIEEYELGPSVDEDGYCSEDDLEIRQKIEDVIYGLETVIRENCGGAHNISQTGRSLVGDEWEERSYGRVYEIYNGAIFVDFVHMYDDEITWLEGKIVFVGDEGFSEGKSKLAQDIRHYLIKCGIEATEEELFSNS